MIIVLELLMAIGLVGVCWWAWEMTGRHPASLGLAALALGVFFWPWVANADWVVVRRVLVAVIAVGSVVLAYAWLLGRIRRAARERDGE
jgi:hypothetical protein